MGVLKSVVKFVADATPVSRLEEIEPGRAAAEGIVRLGEEGEILSPVNSRPCVAFYYRAFAVSTSGRGGFVPRKLRTCEVYHSFWLEMEGGRLRAVPAKTDSFTAEDHRALSGGPYENFRATEDLIAPGTRVRVWGKVKREDEGSVLRYTKIEVLGQPPTAEGSPGRKKRKKKGGKAAKKKGKKR